MLGKQCIYLEGKQTIEEKNKCEIKFTFRGFSIYFLFTWVLFLFCLCTTYRLGFHTVVYFYLKFIKRANIMNLKLHTIFKIYFYWYMYVQGIYIEKWLYIEPFLMISSYHYTFISTFYHFGIYLLRYFYNYFILSKMKKKKLLLLI